MEGMDLILLALLVFGFILFMQSRQKRAAAGPSRTPSVSVNVQR